MESQGVLSYLTTIRGRCDDVVLHNVDDEVVAVDSRDAMSEARAQSTDRCFRERHVSATSKTPSMNITTMNIELIAYAEGSHIIISHVTVLIEPLQRSCLMIPFLPPPTLPLIPSSQVYYLASPVATLIVLVGIKMERQEILEEVIDREGHPHDVLSVGVVLFASVSYLCLRSKENAYQSGLSRSPCSPYRGGDAETGWAADA